MKLLGVWTTILMLALLLLPLGYPHLSVTTSPVLVVSGTDGSVNSSNWSGYAVTGASGSVTAAGSSWVVPSVSCPSLGNLYSSYWVGIDGFKSSTVEQTGTDSDCVSGTPSYYAWYEFYPSPSHRVSGITVHPGDVMAAKVSYSSGIFKIAIKDVTTGAAVMASGTVSGAARSSAEIIVEAPLICGLLKCHLASLADFSSVGFGFDNTGVASSCEMVVDGVTGSIGSFGASVQEISMVSQSNPSLVKAQPSPLTPDGLSFTVQWLSSGP